MTPITVEEVLDRHSGLMRMWSRQYTSLKYDADDLFQEARIALWREALKHPGDNMDKLASYVIKRRVLKLASDEGAPFAAREEGERSWSVKNALSLDGIASAGSEGGDRTAQVLDRLVGSVESAESEAVRAETTARVRVAVAGLPDRQRAVAEGKLEERPDVVTASMLGVVKRRVSQLWQREVIPALRESLAAA